MIPGIYFRKWQRTVDLVAELLPTCSALLVAAGEPMNEVLLVAAGGTVRPGLVGARITAVLC